MIRRFIVATLLLLAATSAHAGFYTDIWYRLGQPGFGYNLVQTDNYIFVTFFIYGSDGKPTWYIAALQRQDDGTFSGELSETRGTFWANPWAGYTETVVGTATFAPADNFYQGTFSYNVPGVGTSTVPVERQTLLSQDLSGIYSGAQTGTLSSCPAQADIVKYRIFFDLNVTQPETAKAAANGSAAKAASTDTTFEFFFTDDGGANYFLKCTLSGTLIQNGLLYRIDDSRYTCDDGLDEPAQMSQIKWTSQGIEGTFFAPKGYAGCAESGYFSAVF